MATTKQRQAARRNVKKAQRGAREAGRGRRAPERRDHPGRSKMGRDELARALGEK